MLLTAALLLGGAGQAPAPSATGETRSQAGKAPSAPVPAEMDAPPVVTHHEARIGGRLLKYTATTGMMPIADAQGKVTGHIFFIAYTLDGVTNRAQRPLTVAFNGGPGSSSVWLHLGAIGPKRVQMLDEGFLPPPPYHLVDNEDSWLDRTDLVFVDPIGTGYSRATSPEEGKKVWGLEGDIASVGEFIRLYLTRYERWTSPLFLAGESYGTTRAAGLSGYLVEHGIALNGIVLISTILNFQTADFARGNDLPYILYVPTYTATAWYHKKLPPDLQKQDLPQVLAEAEKWASTDYTIALQKGTRLTEAERQAAIAQLARYTGLSPAFVDNSDLRITLDRFDAELLRDRKLTVGRLDSRFTGASDLPGSESPDFDPSMTAIRPPYTAMLYDYVRTELGFKSDLRYYILGGGFTSWDFSSDNQYADVSGALWSAFAKNPYMKLLVAMGYYDEATPYYAAEYTLAHLRLPAASRGNVTTAHFRAGHMVYIDKASLAQLKKDVAAFMDATFP
ncbi:MAG: peptidase S10 [Acidobacteriota bacterium]|nr:peptidase S10 [Acidobacteriota bacterium]